MSTTKALSSRSTQGKIIVGPITANIPTSRATISLDQDSNTALKIASQLVITCNGAFDWCFATSTTSADTKLADVAQHGKVYSAGVYTIPIGADTDGDFYYKASSSVTNGFSYYINGED